MNESSTADISGRVVSVTSLFQPATSDLPPFFPEPLAGEPLLPIRFLYLYLHHQSEPLTHPFSLSISASPVGASTAAVFFSVSASEAIVFVPASVPAAGAVETRVPVAAKVPVASGLAEGDLDNNSMQIRTFR